MDPIQYKYPESGSTEEYDQMMADIHDARYQNLELLRNPQPPTDQALFHETATYARLWAEKLYEKSNDTDISVEDQKLAERQEIILYGTSRLRAAVMAWSTASQRKDYTEWNRHWLNGLMDEIVSENSGLHH